tara:strand:- start:4847 stop:5326 length:480 start_codon:yes stop_codon:yes gene_type:complete
MANTIQQTNLSVVITEQIEVNGVEYGNTISKTFAGNGKVDQRVMAISNAALTSIFEYQAALPDTAGTGVKSEFTYFRITNTDDSLAVTIQLYLTSSKTGYIDLPAGCSFVLMSNDVDFLCSGDSFTLADLEKVQAKVTSEESAEAYIEYVAVFQGGVTP